MRRGESTLKRSAIARRTPKGQPPERRDEAFKAFVRTLPCCAPWKFACPSRFIDPHHKHGDGKSIKTHDRTCIPLCRFHHGECEDRRGRFLGWTKQQMRDWHDAESARVQALYAKQQEATEAVVVGEMF